MFHQQPSKEYLCFIKFNTYLHLLIIGKYYTVR